jgi:hypothetical protein
LKIKKPASSNNPNAQRGSLENIPDFSQRRNFPGTLDNEFDVILRKFEDIENIPPIVFAGVLLLLALPPTFGNWTWTVGLWLFYLVDWALLGLLPTAGRSFGPSKPPTLIWQRRAWCLLSCPCPSGWGYRWSERCWWCTVSGSSRTA